MTRTLVLHPFLSKELQGGRTPQLALEEAVALCAAIELEVVRADVVRLAKYHAGYLFGTGKLDELAALIEEEEIALIVVDGPVTPIQQRNLEKKLRIKLLDRTGLILEIFGARARTREGVLQVELAALSYQKSRLVRSWTHLERQRGGLGFIGGAGETQIEADRRAIDDAIVRLKRQLEKVTKTRALHRAARQKIPYPIVALVGYTNAGKSTLFNRLTGADVMAKDMLFATLDPTMRAVRLPNGLEVILSDTVGFISNLPTQLIAAFRATLEEVLDADLILHVRDIAHPETETQAKDVDKILSSLGVDEARHEMRLELWNKTDLLEDAARAACEERAARRDDVVPVSAITGAGLERLCATIAERLEPPKSAQRIRLHYQEGAARAWLYEQELVQGEEMDEAGHHLDILWTARQEAEFAAKFRR